MAKIKICGVRRLEDIEMVNELKPDYVGFVFAKSPRQVCPMQVNILSRNLNPKIKKVGVFLDDSLESVKEILKRCDLDVLQFHGEMIRFKCSAFEKEIWKAIRVKNEQSLNLLKKYDSDRFLLDAYVDHIHGGTGKTFNWDSLKKIDTANIILAGGLNSKNIKQAIDQVNPYAVDISSGVEVNGFKNYKKMKELIEKVRMENE